MVKIITVALGLMISANSMAQKDLNLGKIEAAAAFPVDKLIFFEADNGERGIMSDNGRFVIVGEFKIVDTWTQKEVTSVEGIKNMKNLPISQLKEPLAKSAHIVFGHGEEEFFVFTDLTSKENAALFAQFDDLILSNYKINLVYSSITDDKLSLPINRMFMCSKDLAKAKSVLAEYMGNNELLIKALSQIGEKPGCSLDPLMNSALLAKTAGVKRIPFVVNKNGETKVAPKDLKGFLNE